MRLRLIRKLSRKPKFSFFFKFLRDSIKSATLVCVVLGFFIGFQSFNIIEWIFEAVAEKKTASVNFYPENCMVPNEKLDAKLGWWNIDEVEGQPSLSSNALREEFNLFNSAEYRGGEFEMECYGFTLGDDIRVKTGKNKIIIKEIEKEENEARVEMMEELQTASTSIEIIEEPVATSSVESVEFLSASTSPGIIDKTIEKAKEILSYLTNKNARAKKEQDYDYELNLGEFRKAKIKISMMIDGTNTEVLDYSRDRTEEIQKKTATTSVKISTGTIEVIDMNQVATSGIEIIEEQDIKDNIISRLFKVLKAEAQSDEEIALIMYYSLNSLDNNALWQELDRFNAKSFSNTDFEDYLSYSADFINDWQDIEDLGIKMVGKIKGETELKMFWDNVFVEAEYEYDDELFENTALEDPDRLKLENEEVEFDYTDENSNENLIIKTDKKTYFGLSEAKVYFNITNEGTRREQLDIKTYFPGDKGRVKEFKRINIGEQYTVREPVFGPRSFYCESLWQEELASTSPASTYSCIDTSEYKICDSLVASSSVCRQERSVIRYKNIIKERIEKNELNVAKDKREKPNKILSLFKKNRQKDVPEYFKTIEKAEDSNYLYPGETAYYEMIIEYPFGSKGEFYIEAIGSNEAYGLLDPWWEQDWSYKLPITIDNTANDRELEYYQVMVEIASSTTGFWEHVQVDGADVRFVNQDESGELDFYEVLFLASSTARYWVKVDNISTSSQEEIYLYYGNNNSVTSQSSAEDTFSYATSTARFVAMGDYNPAIAAAGATFFDDNIFGVPGLYDSDWDTGAAENPKAIANAYTADGTVASSTKPFAITGDGNSGEMWVPLSWQSKEFVTTSRRDDINLYFYNPSSTSTTITLDRNGVYDQHFSLGANSYVEKTSLTYVTDDHWRVTSTEPILLFEAGGGTGNDRDIHPLSPPALEHHGIVRNTRLICTEDSTNYTFYFSDSSTETGSCSANSVIAISKAGGSYGSGPAARVVTTKPVSLWSNADGDGYEQQAWYPSEDLDTEYLIPDDYSYLSCAAPYDNTTITVYNMSGTQQATSGDLGSNGDYPHIWLDNNTRTGGMRVRADYPIYCYYDQTPGSDGSDENNAANRVINRKGTWPRPSVSVESELIIDNPIVEQSSFRWYANENKSEIGHVFVEVLSYQSTTEQSSFVNVVTASSSEFIGGDTYLIYVQAGFGGSVADVTTDFEVSFGASTQYTGLVEGPGDAYDAYQVSWFDVYTQPGTPEDIELNYRTNNGASYVLNAQIIAINLSDLNASDYKYSSDTSASTHASSPSWDTRASITLDQADGDKDWLVLATEEVEVNSSGVSFQGEIYDGSSSYMGVTIEGEDSDELLPYTLIRAFEDVVADTSFTLRTRDDDTGTNNHIESRIFALNLDAFESKKVYSLDTNTAISNTAWTEIGNLNSGGNYQPQMSGTQILFSSYINEHDGSSDGLDFRLMVDSATSSSEWSWRQNVIPSRTNHDFDDELINTVVGMAEIDSGGVPISMDAIELSGTAQIGDEVSMTVFSTLLKTATSTLSEAEITPNNPWPGIGGDADEDTVISSEGPGNGDVLRLRLALHVTNASATPGSLEYKLQYGEGTNCSALSNWTDVGKLASSTIWRGYDNTSIADATTIATTVLSVSDVGGSYEEENNSTSTKNEVGINEDVEWDWVLENNGAAPSTSYCFRMVNSNGIELDTYSNYPRLLTNASVAGPSLGGVFDMEKINDITPNFTFNVSDSDSDDLVYQISWSSDYSFISSSTKRSDIDNGFINISTAGDLNPFNSGDTVRYTVQAGDALSNNTSYYWRVRAKDPDGSNVWGTWSDIRSFTVDTGVSVTTWHQTTDEQFDDGDFTNRTYTEGSDRVVVVPKIAEYGTTTLSGETPSVINLNYMYDEPIVVATPRYWEGPTRLVRVYNKTDTSFTVMVDDYDDTLGTMETGIDYMVMEAGTWTIDDDSAGFQVIASSSLTAGIGGGGGTAWDTPVTLYYDNNFTSAPVVIHNISSNNDSNWIASNANDGSTHTTEPTISQIGFLMNRGKDSGATHDPETIDWLAFEPGTGTNNGVGYALINEPDGTIEGFANNPPYTVSYSGAFSSLPAVELSSQLGEDGGDGSFSIYYGDFASSSISAYYIALDEGNSVGDRAHTQEPASVVAFESGGDNTITVLDDLSGIYTSPAISYSLGTDVAGWDNISWDVSTTSGDFYMQVEYNTGSSWEAVPDINIPGNSSGICCSPLDISSLNVYTYNELRLKAILSLETNSARLNDWTVTWKEPLRFEGVVYSDLGDTPLLTEPRVNLAVDGVFVASGTASNIDGSFSITYGNYLPSGSSTILYLEDSNEKGAVINKYDGNGHVQDLEIYQNTYIVRNDYDNSINNSDIAEFDQSNDDDINILVNGNNLSASSSWGMYVWSNTNYIPGGTVTLASGLASTSVGGDMNIASTSSVLNIENNNLSIGSDLINNGTLVRANTQTTYFTATGTDYSINIGTSSFANLVINNTGLFNLTTSTIIENDLNIATGTLKTTHNLTVVGGNFYGDGVLNSSIGTTTLLGTGNFGGDYNWTFDNLVFGSGSSDVSTKIGSGNITINNNLYISSGQTLEAGSSIWEITSAGSPFQVNGTLSAQSSRFYFSASADTEIPALNYNRLLLSPSGSGNPDYTIGAGTLATNDYLQFGLGVYPLTVDASTSDPLIDIEGDIIISTLAYLEAPRGNSIYAGGDWINQGTFVSNRGRVVLDSTASDNSIYSGNSSFYDLEINNNSGSWLLEESATTSNNLVLNDAINFTASSSIFIEVQGQFWNSLESASTTWNNSVLYLNASSSASYAINASTTGDYYPALRIGSVTQLRMWNSSSSDYILDSGASLYSMNHDNVDGELYIFGQYVKDYGTDYWSYATDFDGSSLGGGNERQAKVYIASSSLVQYSASNLEMIGISSASTTVSNQGVGNFELINYNGSINANYYQLRDVDSEGWQLRGSLTVNSINNGDFLLEENGATLLTISSTTIDYNSAKNVSGLYLASSTDILGYGALVDGSAGSFWQFTSYSGQLGGEAHDSDYGGICGALRWLDSECTDIALKHYRWRNDNGSEALATWKSNEDAFNYDQAKEENLRLRFSVDNEDADETENVYYKLQSSALSDFATCTSVPSINFNDVATSSSGSEYVLMASSSQVSDQDSTSAQLTSEGIFRSGYIVAHPKNTSAAVNLLTGEYTELEYVLEFTGSAKSNAEYCFRLVQNEIDFNSYEEEAEVEMIGVSIFGNAYNDDLSAWSECDGSTGNLSMNIAGAFIATTTCNASTGHFEFINIDFNNNDPLSIYYNNIDQANTVTLTSNNYTDIPIYLIEDQLWFRSEDSETALTNTHLGLCDTVVCNNTGFMVNGDDLIASTSMGIKVGTSTIYRPGGEVALPNGSASSTYGGDMVIMNTGTLDMDDHDLLLGSDMFNNGTFSRESGQLCIFSATSSGYRIDSGGYSFANVLFRGENGTWTFTNNTTINGDLSIASGTLLGTVDITVNGGDVSGEGVIYLSGGIFVLDSSGDFGSDSDWSFYNLEFGDGLWSADTTKVGTGTVTVLNSLRILSSQSLHASDSTWIISGSGVPLQVNGILEADTSILRFDSSSNASIWAGDYYNLEFKPMSGSPTYTISSGALSVANDLIIGNGINSLSVNTALNDPSIDVEGEFRVNNNAGFIAPPSSSFTIAGDFSDYGSITHSNGLIVFDANATGTVIIASSSLYNIDFDNVSGGWIIASDIRAENDFDLSKGIEFVSSSSVPWYNNSWLKRKTIRINSDMVDDYLYDFPVYINIVDTDVGNNTQDSGEDILFTGANGVSKLSHEIEYYSTTTGVMQIWVKVDKLDPDQDTLLYLYYDNSGASDQQDASGVWEEYVGVWHLNENPSVGADDVFMDSGVGAYHAGSRGNLSASTSAMLGQGLTFDGVDAYAPIKDFNYNQIGGVPKVTACFWVNTDEASPQCSVLDYDRSQYWSLGINFGGTADNSGEITWDTTGEGVTDIDDMSSTIEINDGTWHYICASFDSTAEYDKKIYIDGELDSRKDAHSNGERLGDSDASENPRYGLMGDGSEYSTYDGSGNSQFFEGTLDEARFTHNVRTEEWIKTEFNNQMYQNQFIRSVGSEEAFSGEGSITIEVQGSFRNELSNASTTWLGSTLYLNGTDHSINIKSNEGDEYYNLQVGSNTDIRAWNSSAHFYSITDTASLYIMDYAAQDGSLNIWGDYDSPSAEYWSYSKDFDSTSLVGGNERQVTVRIATSSSVSFGAGVVEIIGNSGNNTIIKNQGTSTYSITLDSNTMSASYYEFHDMDASGLNITNSSDINNLDNGEFYLAVESGTLISLDSSSLDTSGNLEIDNVVFSVRELVESGTNVTLDSSAGSYWLFASHSGILDGEANDSDPGDPRGYIIWDDSPDYTPVNQDWRWYYDEASTTPSLAAAAVNTAPSNIAPNARIKLRMTINESEGLSTQNVKMRLEYSTMPDFSSDTNYVGEIGSSSALWTYYDGGGVDNDLIDDRVLSDNVGARTHNESALSYSPYGQSAGTAYEWEFTLRNNNAPVSTTYYFRAIARYDSVIGTSTKTVYYNTGESYPSLFVNEGSIGFILSGISSGQSIEGITTDFDTSAFQVDFGEVMPGSELEGAQRFEISTNAEFGYQLLAFGRQNMMSGYGNQINPISTTNEVPGAWTIGSNLSGFGYHTGDDTLSGSDPSRFSFDDSYAGFELSLDEVSYSPIAVSNETVDFIYKLEVGDMQEAGDYETEVVYIVVPTY